MSLIGTKRTCRGGLTMSAPEGKTDGPREPGHSVFEPGCVKTRSYILVASPTRWPRSRFLGADRFHQSANVRITRFML